MNTPSKTVWAKALGQEGAGHRGPERSLFGVLGPEWREV